MLRWDDEKPLFLDFETQSTVDIKKYGGRLYAEHESTRVLSLVAYFDNQYHTWIPDWIVAPHLDCGDTHLHRGATVPAVISEYASEHAVVAHNALGFDRYIWNRVSDIRPAWADTMLIARSLGLPAGLDALARYIGIGQKDDGHRFLRDLIFAVETPNGYQYPITPSGKLNAVIKYNIGDVKLLKDAWDKFCSDETISIEADVIATHDEINDRGVLIDVDLLYKLERIGEISVSQATNEINELVAKANGRLGSDVTIEKLRSTKQVHAWLSQFGISIKDFNGKASLRKDIVEQCLANPWMMVNDYDNPVETSKSIPPEVFDVLRLRATALRITGSKAANAKNRVHGDDRARGCFQYHAAHTGRETSTGINVNNLPRPKKGVDIDKIIEFHESGKWSDNYFESGEAEYRFIKSCTKTTVDDALSSLLRPSIKASDKHRLVIADFAQIECRYLAWMAKESFLLNLFQQNKDFYRATASNIYNVPVELIDDYQRQVGKVTVLGAGYQMSDGKFGIYAALQGINLEKAGITALDCIEGFRNSVPGIAGVPSGKWRGKTIYRGGLWDKLIRAATSAINGGVFSAGNNTFMMVRGNLHCVLPSGRTIRYNNARIEDRVPIWGGEPRATLIYDNPRGETFLHPGKITENVDQAGCRDIMETCKVKINKVYPVTMTCYDEIVCEVPETDADDCLEYMLDVMSTPMKWCADLPLKVEAYISDRYEKLNEGKHKHGSRTASN